MGNQNFIVINGKKYDAVTGKLLSEQQTPVNTVERIIPKANTGVVDGFVKPKKNNINRVPAKNAAKPQQRSQTLARKAVKKPDTIISSKQQHKPGILKKRLGVSPRREFFAKEVSKSPHVSKFGENNPKSSIVKKSVEAPVKNPPVHTQQANPEKVQKASNATSKQSNTVSHSIIESALANAESHSQPHHQQTKKKNRLISRLGISSKAIALSSAALAVVLLAGFYTYQNVPNLSMRVAATRAGFDARMPGYKPSGFAFRGPINYQPGEVTVTFKSNSDDREFNFTQNASNWNSDALLANYIEKDSKQYQTYQDRGRTLYIYNGSNATWVDDGIWYRIEGNSQMTTDQLIRIASSI